MDNRSAAGRSASGSGPALWRIAFHTLAVAIDPGQYFAHPLRLKAHHAEWWDADLQVPSHESNHRCYVVLCRFARKRDAPLKLIASSASRRLKSPAPGKTEKMAGVLGVHPLMRRVAADTDPVDARRSETAPTGTSGRSDTRGGLRRTVRQWLSPAGERRPGFAAISAVIAAPVPFPSGKRFYGVRRVI